MCYSKIGNFPVLFTEIYYYNKIGTRLLLHTGHFVAQTVI